MRLLIVVDMQNDFIDGALGTKEAVAIVGRVKKKIEECREHADQIIFTRDTHKTNYLETSEGKNLPVEHCIEGTYGWQISKELDDANYLHIDKSNFGWLGWNEIDMTAVSEIELVGLCTDICVVSNALILKAMYPEIPVMVDANCCAGVTPQTHRAALETMKMCQIQVTGEE